MTFRESINNLIRTDKPESPTELIFIAGGLTLLGLQIYATQRQVQIPHFSEMLAAMAVYKGTKVVKGYNEGKVKVACECTPKGAPDVPTNQPPQ